MARRRKCRSCAGTWRGILAGGDPAECSERLPSCSSPLACAGDGTGHLCPFGVAAYAGIGLANAGELRSDEYSRGRRFLLNVAAWHLAFGVMAAVDWAHERPPPAAGERGAAVAIGIAAGGTPRVVVSGRF